MATQTTSNGQFTNQHTQNTGPIAGQFNGQFGGQPVQGTVPGVQTPWFSGVGQTPAFNGFGGFNGFNSFNGWNPGFTPTFGQSFGQPIGQTFPGVWNNSFNTLGTINPFNTVNPFTSAGFNGVNPFAAYNPYATINPFTSFNAFNPSFNTVNPFGTFNGVNTWGNTPVTTPFQSPVNGWFNGQTSPVSPFNTNAFYASAFGTNPFTTNPFYANAPINTINNPFFSTINNPFAGIYGGGITNPFISGINSGYNTLNTGWNTPWAMQTPWSVQNAINCPISADCSCPPGVCVGPTGGTFNSIPTSPIGLVNPITNSLTNTFGYTQPYGYNVPVTGGITGGLPFGATFNAQNWTPAFAQNWFQNYTNGFSPNAFNATGFNTGFSGLNGVQNTWGYNPFAGTPSFQVPSFVNGITYPTTGPINGTFNPTASFNAVNPFVGGASRWNGLVNPITQSLIAQNLGYGVNTVNGFNSINGFNAVTPGFTPSFFNPYSTTLNSAFNSGFAPVLNGLAGGIGSVYAYGSPITGYPINGFANPMTASVNGLATVVPTVNGQTTGSASNVGQNGTISPVLVGSCRAAA